MKLLINEKAGYVHGKGDENT